MNNTKLPISVFIICRNEADRIANTINSVKNWVDEIIVVDSGSTDETVEIAKSSGANKVIYNKWPGYGQQKIFAERSCKNSWLLNLDADEVISDDLAQEIIQLFAKGADPKKAYSLRIKLTFMYQSKPSLLAHQNCPVRLYHKSAGSFRDSTVHDAVVLNEGVKRIRLQGLVCHYSFRDLHHTLEKQNDYTTMLAKNMVKKGRRPSLLRIMLEPIWTFLKSYILRRYFIYGSQGFSISLIYAVTRTLKMTKTREIYKITKRK